MNHKQPKEPSATEDVILPYNLRGGVSGCVYGMHCRSII